MTRRGAATRADDSRSTRDLILDAAERHFAERGFTGVSVAAGLYNLIFGYFANAALLEVVVQKDPRSSVAIARQRRFLKRAVAGLLGVKASGRTRSSDRFRNG